MDLLIVIGLPRSGTSLVYNQIHEYRAAVSFRNIGIKLKGIPRKVYDLNKTLKDEDSLAEINDYPGTLGEFRNHLERARTDTWVAKTPDLSLLPELFDVFPEARYLWCLRPAGETLASIREYWQVAGVGPEYQILPTVDMALHYARAFPEKFDCIFTPSIPEWESDRDDPIESPEAFQLELMLKQVKGACRNVSSRDFKKLYS